MFFLPIVTKVFTHNCKLNYNHFEFSDIRDERLNSLIADEAKELKNLCLTAGLNRFCSFAYIDGNVLHLIFNYCDVNGNLFTEKERDKLISCMAG